MLTLTSKLIVGNLNLEDQVKAANRDKLLAEAEKAKSERKRVEFDLFELQSETNKSWFFKKDAITKIGTSVVLVITFLSFFIPFVVLPAFNKDNIELATQNAITKDSLYKQGKILIDKTKILQSDSVKNFNLSINLQKKEKELAEAIQARKQIDVNYNNVFKLYSEAISKPSQNIISAKERLITSLNKFPKLQDFGGSIETTVPIIVRDVKPKYYGIDLKLNPNNGVLPVKKGINNFFPIVLISTSDSTTFTLYASRRVNNSYASYAGNVLLGSYYIFSKSSTYKIKDNFILDIDPLKNKSFPYFEVPIVVK